MEVRNVKLHTIHAGQPREVEYNGQTISTAIYKDQISGPIQVRVLGLEGDGQADLSVHGGIDKAVYAYPLEHYDFWKKNRKDLDFFPGVFGENLSISGLDENIRIGTVLQIGKVRLQVTIPRMPCYKLGIRMKDPGFVRDFMQEGRNGFYLKVIQEGTIEGNEHIQVTKPENSILTIRDLISLYTTDKYNFELLQQAVDNEWLPDDWREYFRKRL